MPLEFSDLESTLAVTAVDAFANAAITWTGHSEVGVFDAYYADPLGMSNASPSITCTDAAVSALALDTTVAIVKAGVSTSYKVREKQPDGLGITRLILQAA